MLLVADSGSTKADWILTRSDEQTIHFRTKGINPFFLSEKEIITVLQNAAEIQPYVNEVKEIYFFGAGCSSPDKREIISNAITKVFKNAFVSVDKDIVASIYATAGSSPGIIGILGTGSNVSYFDGTKIHESKHGLGYILGDEGSGTYFGRQLLTNFLYGTMPPELSAAFDEKFQITKELVIKRVYQKVSPNSFLASFAPFMSDQIGHVWIKDLLKKGFENFVETNIKSYPNFRSQTSHFVGSIAYHFDDILREVCAAKHIKVGKILKHPIDNLSAFILNNEVKPL